MKDFLVPFTIGAVGMFLCIFGVLYALGLSYNKGKDDWKKEFDEKWERENE